MDTSMESVTGGAPSIRRLIVPPGHDVPIKQTMVDIFAKQREPQNESGNDGDGGLGEVAAHGSEQPKIPSQHGDDGLGGVAAGGGEQPAVPTPKTKWNSCCGWWNFTYSYLWRTSLEAHW